METLPVSIVNLKERIDRLLHIQNQFEGNEEFDCSILSASKQDDGRLGLWNNLLKVVKAAKKLGMEYVIFCEDDHQFTRSYRYKNLMRAIKEANRYEADLLLGGVSWFDNVLQVSGQLFWVSHFTGLQFTVIYARFYDIILDAEFGSLDAADIKLSSLSSRKFVIHPFISIQHEFGYSDVTSRNNQIGHVKKLFRTSSAALTRVRKVKKFYNKMITKTVDEDFSDISIPTYVMSFDNNSRLITKIEAQFKGRAEFDTNIVKVLKDRLGAVLLWSTIRKIVQTANDNDDDVIIICEDGHQFTLNYNKEFLLKNIIEASDQRAEILFGNAINLAQIVPVTSERYWINLVERCSFIIIYKSLFQKILSSPFKEDDETLKFLCMLTSHKMVLYPFVSVNINPHGFNEIKNNDEIKIGLIKDAIKELNL